jgi:hypothetical protein
MPCADRCRLQGWMLTAFLAYVIGRWGAGNELPISCVVERIDSAFDQQTGSCAASRARCSHIGICSGLYTMPCIIAARAFRALTIDPSDAQELVERSRDREIREPPILERVAAGFTELLHRPRIHALSRFAGGSYPPGPDNSTVSGQVSLTQPTHVTPARWAPHPASPAGLMHLGLGVGSKGMKSGARAEH